MNPPVSAWLITPLFIPLFLCREVQADTLKNDYDQLKARIEILEKELATLKKQQNKKITKKATPSSNQALNNKQLIAFIEKWTKENITNQKHKKKYNKGKRLVRKKELKKTTPTKRKKQQKNKKIAPKKNRKKLIKRALFPKSGKIKASLQYSITETTGTQLSVDGFSLLPIFVVGNIESQDIVNTSHTANLSISRSLPNDSQISLNIPYSQKTEELTNDSGLTTVQTRKKSKGLGDIRVTYSKQIFRNAHKLPALIGAVTWKTTTGKSPYKDSQALALGSGFNAIRTGITAIKQDDPSVLFASTGYTMNMGDNKGSFGDIDPGNTYDLALGVVYSLTDSLSMNFGLEQAWTTETRVNNINAVNSDPHTAALSVGAKLKMSPKRSINIRTKIGLNDSTPGFQMQIGVPLKN